jgi:hypothetical protein
MVFLIENHTPKNENYGQKTQKAFFEKVVILKSEVNFYFVTQHTKGAAGWNQQMSSTHTAARTLSG